MKTFAIIGLSIINYFVTTTFTCNFSSLFPFDELELELFVCNGEPGAIHAGADTSRSQ